MQTPDLFESETTVGPGSSHKIRSQEPEAKADEPPKAPPIRKATNGKGAVELPDVLQDGAPFE